MSCICSISAASEKADCEIKLKASLSSFLSNEELINANDFSDVRIVYLGELKDSIDIYAYADTLSMPNATFSAVERGGTQVNNDKTDWHIIKPCTYVDYFYQYNRNDIMRVAEHVQQQLATAHRIVLSTLQIGNLVFSVNFKYQGREFKTFIFYNDSCKVVYSQVFKPLR